MEYSDRKKLYEIHKKLFEVIAAIEDCISIQTCQFCDKTYLEYDGDRGLCDECNQRKDAEQEAADE